MTLAFNIPSSLRVRRRGELTQDSPIYPPVAAISAAPDCPSHVWGPGAHQGQFLVAGAWMLKRLARLPSLLVSIALGVSVPTAAAAFAPSPVAVIEYYSMELDHYFITADSAEAAALDAGVIQGWTRTGHQFTA